MVDDMSEEAFGGNFPGERLSLLRIRFSALGASPAPENGDAEMATLAAPEHHRPLPLPSAIR